MRPKAITDLLRGTVVELLRPGESELSGKSLVRLGELGLTSAIVVANLVGAMIVVAVAMFVVPMPAVDDAADVRLVNAIAATAYVAGAVPVGVIAGFRRLRPVRRWLAEERAPDPREQRALLRAPLGLFFVQVGLWLGAALLFGALNLTYSFELARKVAITVALTGVTTAAIAYLLAERILRPATARALAGGAPDRLQVPGVASRAILAWALGTGVPVFGAVAIGASVLFGEAGTRQQLAIVMVVLGGTALTFGLLAVAVAARATADPIDAVRRALAKVQRGDFDVRLHAYDGTQIGQLQLGFNEMAAGLAERARLRHALGTYVDPDVAEHILREGTDLGGEEVEVTIMFVDVRGFTGYAEARSARQVVATVNRLFERAVPIIHAHSGHVDKFVGDGLLAVFGAPRRQTDHADQALAAALEIEQGVREEFGADLQVGIGLNSGTVVAGNVGGAGRLEFSVIGDTVNVAARVEAATRQTGDVILIAEPTVELLRDSRVALDERPDVALTGRREAISVYAPPRTGLGRPGARGQGGP